MKYMQTDKPKIGFIGQGWIGKNLADNFEERGHHVVRFAKESPYDQNLPELKKADIVFIAVPTPTTKDGFDAHILKSVIKNAVSGQIIVIKSTVLPGTTDQIAKDNPDLFIFHAPEFLREASVRKDIAEPERNIIGIPEIHVDDVVWKGKAQLILSVLPEAPYTVVCSAVEAELTKYGGNNFLYTKVVFMNMLYDLAEKHGARFDVVAKNMSADPRIGNSHMQPVHQYEHMASGKHLQGRGAGGHCFIKDFAAMRKHYQEVLPEDNEMIRFLCALEAANNSLLTKTQKDLDLLSGVYGENIPCACVMSGSEVCQCNRKNNKK